MTTRIRLYVCFDQLLQITNCLYTLMYLEVCICTCERLMSLLSASAALEPDGSWTCSSFWTLLCFPKGFFCQTISSLLSTAAAFKPIRKHWWWLNGSSPCGCYIMIHLRQCQLMCLSLCLCVIGIFHQLLSKLSLAWFGDSLNIVYHVDVS